VTDPRFFVGEDAPLRKGVTSCPIAVILETHMSSQGGEGVQTPAPSP